MGKSLARIPNLDACLGQLVYATGSHTLGNCLEDWSTCPAIDGIIEEGQEILEEFKGSPATDAGLLAAA